MTKNFLYTEEGLFREIVEKASEEGVATREEWNELVEQIIDEHRGAGEMDDDEDLENLEDTLKKRYPEYEDSLRVE